MVICNRCLLGNNIDLFKYLYDFLGTQGADLPIQLKYPAMSVGYNLTMGEAVGITLLLGYFFTLGIMGITLFMSALLKNTYVVIIVRISVDYNPNNFYHWIRGDMCGAMYYLYYHLK